MNASSTEIGRITLKSAYLVLAHQAPDHFGRLASALALDADAATFVHLDRRADLEVFRRSAGDAPVGFVDSRIACNWGGFSIVDATLRALRLARASGEFDRFTLLSGDTYPLRHPRAIADHWSRNPQTDFINMVRLPSPEAGKPLRRVSHYYIEHDPRRNRATKAFKALQRVMVRPRYQAQLGGRQPYAGSQWWSLSRGTVDAVLAATETPSPYVRFMRHTLIPDEHFFQTLVGNLESRRLEPGVMYTDFLTPGPKPAPISAVHLATFAGPATAVHTDAYGSRVPLFARKYSNESEELVAATRDTLWALPVTSEKAVAD